MLLSGPQHRPQLDVLLVVLLIYQQQKMTSEELFAQGCKESFRVRINPGFLTFGSDSFNTLLVV